MIPCRLLPGAREKEINVYYKSSGYTAVLDYSLVGMDSCGSLKRAKDLRGRLCDGKTHAAVKLIDERGRDACARHQRLPRWEYTLTRLGSAPLMQVLPVLFVIGLQLAKGP